jgi:hypothetical protein
MPYMLGNMKRKYVQETGRRVTLPGWLLDIARCIYSLRTGGVIAKTAVGEWAVKENIAPDAQSVFVYFCLLFS